MVHETHTQVVNSSVNWREDVGVEFGSVEVWKVERQKCEASREKSLR